MAGGLLYRAQKNGAQRSKIIVAIRSDLQHRYNPSTSCPLQLRIEQRHMQPDQPHSATAPPFVPGFVGGGEQILFIQARPDMFLSGQLKIIEFQLLPPDGQSEGPV